MTGLALDDMHAVEAALAGRLPTVLRGGSTVSMVGQAREPGRLLGLELLPPVLAMVTRVGVAQPEVHRSAVPQARYGGPAPRTRRLTPQPAPLQARPPTMRMTTAEPSVHAVFRVALIAVLTLVGCAGAEMLSDASIPDQGEEDVLLPQILHLSGEDAEAPAPDGASAVDSDASAPPPAADPVDAEGQSADAPTPHFALAEPAVLMPGGVFTITAVVRGAPAIGGVVRAGGIERAFDWSTGRTWTAEVPWWTFEPLALAPGESIRFGAELIFVDAQGREGRAAAPIELHLSCQCPGGEACDGSGCLLPDPPCIEPGCPPGERCAYLCERLEVCLNTTGNCTDACVSGNPFFDCLDDESRRLAEPDPCIAWPACLEAAR